MRKSRFSVEQIVYALKQVDAGLPAIELPWERARSKCGFDLIISDIRMPGFTGLEVLEGLRDECAPRIGETPITLLTAFGDLEVHADAERLGAVVFDKPFDLDEFQACARNMIAPALG